MIWGYTPISGNPQMDCNNWYGSLSFHQLSSRTGIVAFAERPRLVYATFPVLDFQI